MLLELIIALSVGIIFGTITGLLPGIHINLVGSILVALSLSVLSGFEPIILVVFIVSMSITHTFIDFIPSIYLGAPDDASALSVLPGHKLLAEGKAHEAVLLTTLGCLIAIFITILLSPILIKFIPSLNSVINTFIPYILILVSLFLIFTEKNKIIAIIIFILAAFLGISVLNLPIDEPLLPMLSGLFGASTLIVSIKEKTKIPEQKIIRIKEIQISKKEFFLPSSITILVSSLLGFMPALGSGQIAIISSEIKKATNRQFLLILGISNMMIMILSFLTIYTINKARTGSAAAIQQLLNKINQNQLTLILITIFITGLIVFFLTIYLSKSFSKLITKINYSKISIFILFFVSIIVIFFSGWLGFLIFATSAAVGILGIQSNIKRTNLMACLLVPTIILYLF